MMKAQLNNMIRADTTTEETRAIAGKILTLVYYLETSLQERR